MITFKTMILLEMGKKKFPIADIKRDAETILFPFSLSKKGPPTIEPNKYPKLLAVVKKEISPSVLRKKKKRETQ